MEVAFPSSPPAKCIGDDRLTEISIDFTKLGFPEEEEINKLERSWSKLEESVEFNEDEDDEEDEEEEEFSFACVNGEGSPITADEAFEDGQIRPVFPLFNRDLLFDYENDDDKSDDVSVTDENRPRLRKLFVEDRNGDGDGEETEDSEKEPLGPYCSWSGGTVAEASPETCRKSNSTGFSKLWRFRDLVLRSNSDGRDAFVFLNNNNNVGDKTRTRSSSSSSTAAAENEKKVIITEKKKGKEKTTTTETKKKTMTKSAHEKLYMRNRAMKEEVKHRSYLPYKQVGFFTNVNGLSRNIHPF
ncbi:hypothetical protein ARALYDRAFT_472633 [Arabidopsis lyrata subsp. lyrata]|uniref:Uncharacterized protein n=1 Tax=Arabidopsis lyrata subsp. lyrata TaxID=81972 RepID=D7KNI3_ARALL|nr:uncharacterized protein LOC9326652 [Arabidopsis lyrata subsp. lyrata]EFH66849.1 hypothetical protein ARALYDRAFT_472633 [Arabidopsis lyrata subsp. lyrata]|eukprot:XP_002890590.1 uncharacterized protein LOC9326652 [Arabidopsis lyrata subsp. lyrata]